jgi:hypothetical protein
MPTAEERMELEVLRNHGAGHSEAGACYGAVAQHGAAVLA